MTFYAIDGVTGPVGSPTQVGAPSLGSTLPAVSQPTPGSLESDVDSDGWEHAWWKVTPAESGERMVDTTLSYDSDGTPLPCYVDVFTYDGTTYDFYDGTFGSGPITFDAGVDYYLSVGRQFGDGDGTSSILLRVGALATPATPWTQGDNVEWVTSGPGNLVSADSNPLGSKPNGLRWADGLLQAAAYFQGSYLFQQAFGGPNPGTQTDTYTPLWRNARVGAAGSQWWSEDPTNPSTDIHASWHGGPGTPLYFDDGRSLPGGGSLGGVAGSVYDAVAGSFGIPGNDSWNTYAFAMRLHLTSITEDFGPTAGRSITPEDDGLPGGFEGDIEFEDTQCSITKLEGQPDEPSGDGHVGTVSWYAKSVPMVDGVAGKWGPSMNDPDTGVGDTEYPGWQGGDDQPDGFADLQDQVIGPFAGTGLGWTEIDEGIVGAAIAEEADEANIGGLRLVCMADEMLSLTPPATCAPTGVDAEHIDAYRSGQSLALRLTLTPARHRWIPDPVVPEVEILEPTGTADDVRRRFF